MIDAWAGLADRAAVKPVDGDTLFMLSSTSKGVTATCAAVLADRGTLDYDRPVASYWPEFAALGPDSGPDAGPNAFGHVGGGGSFGYADPDRHFAIAFAKNFFTYNTGAPSTRRSGQIVADAVFAALGMAGGV